MSSDIKGRIEASFYQLDLVKQAIRGIAHLGATGCLEIADIEREVLAVEGVIDGVQAVLEKAGEELVRKEAA